MKAPRSGPRRAPGGSVQTEASEMVCYSTFDHSFRTASYHRQPILEQREDVAAVAVGCSWHSRAHDVLLQRMILAVAGHLPDLTSRRPRIGPRL